MYISGGLREREGRSFFGNNPLTFLLSRSLPSHFLEHMYGKTSEVEWIIRS
jgi:hypothetical protein